MIFKTEAENFHLLESYKERNLYYKIFAGYLLNEIIPGYGQRKEKLLHLLKNIRKEEQRFIDPFDKTQIVFEALEKETWNITFDYHITQCFTGVDGGEMSDILLHTKSSIISFECKYTSNFDIQDDIYSVHDRIRKFCDEFDLAAVQVLLLKKDKWNKSTKITGRYDPSALADKNIPIIVIFWEELSEIIDDSRVKFFLNTQIARPRKGAKTIVRN
jgi:hypothetical protein